MQDVRSELRALKVLFTCYIEPNHAQYVWVYSYKIQRKTSKCLSTFLIRRNWEGSDVCRFSLANSSLSFLGVCWAVLRA